MIVKRTTLFLIGILFLGCYGLKNPKKPKNLISKDDMVNILIDIRLISATTGSNKKILDKEVTDKEAYILNKYNIDSLQFALSNEYYAYRVDDYDDIYTRVKDSLEALKIYYKDLETKEINTKKKQDSLRELVKKDRLILNKKLDSVKVSMQKDTLGLKMKLDSIRAAHQSIRREIENDSLLEVEFMEQVKKEGLIPPVSDNVGQD